MAAERVTQPGVPSLPAGEPQATPHSLMVAGPGHVCSSVPVWPQQGARLPPGGLLPQEG